MKSGVNMNYYTDRKDCLMKMVLKYTKDGSLTFSQEGRRNNMKVTQEQVEKIKELYALGKGPKHIAWLLDITPSMAWYYANREKKLQSIKNWQKKSEYKLDPEKNRNAVRRFYERKDKAESERLIKEFADAQKCSRCGGVMEKRRQGGKDPVCQKCQKEAGRLRAILLKTKNHRLR